jgi:alpha-2-macroglobulin
MNRSKSLFFILIFSLIMAINTSIAQETTETAMQEGLTILAVSPLSEAQDVNPNGLQITLSFDRSVVPITELSRSSTFTFLNFEPAIEGTGEWVHPAVYVFTPSENAIQGGIAYRVSIQEALVALDGTRLSLPYEWTFQTIQPQVVQIRATRVHNQYALLDTAIEVSFSQPMDHTSTEAAFSLLDYIGPMCNDGCSNNPEDWAALEGRYSWSADSKRLTFTPSEALEYATSYYGNYRAVLNNTALNQDGLASIESPASVYINPVPRPVVASITPRMNEAVAPGVHTVSIEFAGAMNTETYRGHYTVSPTPPGEITPFVSEDGTLRLVFEHVVGTDYTITVLPGIEDIYGTATENSVSVTYRVREPQAEQRIYLGAQPFSIAGTYLENPSIPLNIRGSAQVTSKVYQADLAMLFDVAQANQWSLSGRFNLWQFYEPQGLYRCCDYVLANTYRIPWIQPENLLRVSSSTYQAGNEEETFYHPLLSEGDEPLPMGIYGVDVNEAMGMVVAVANTNITVKRSSDEVLVWLTDFLTAAPVANVQVTIQNSEESWTATSDAQGLARFDFEAAPYGILFITAEAAGIFGIWYSESGVIERPTGIYLYTDRRLYRPGEPVYYRGILRDGSDLNYIVPTDTETVYLRLDGRSCYDYDCEPLSVYEEQVSLNEFGTFSADFELPTDLAPGNYYLRVSTCPSETEPCENQRSGSVYFNVAEFRVPDFTVELNPQYEEILSGEALNVDVAAAYYFGGMVSEGTLRRYGFGTSIGFVYRGSETGYRFGDTEAYSRAELYRPGETLEIGADGHYLLTDIITVTGSFPVNFKLEATVMDSSGQSISGRRNLILHPANLYIGVKAPSSYSDENTPVQIDMLTIFPDSSIRPNEVLQLEIYEKRTVRVETSFGVYEWRYETTPVTSALIQTDETGHATYEFVPPNAGNFLIRLRGSDELGRNAQTAITVYVRGQSLDTSNFGNPYTYSQCQQGEVYMQLRLVADKDNYLPGETATVSFINPYEAAVDALITIERNGIRKDEIRSIEPGLNSYSLLLDGDDAPNIFVMVFLIRPVALESDLPQFLKGGTYLRIDNLERRLNIDIRPSTLIAEPGQEVRFDFYVTDSNGEPVSAEIGASLSDIAVLDLVPYQDYNTLENHFYPFQRAGVQTHSAGMALLRDVPIDFDSLCGNGGGGGGMLGVSLRDDFVYTPMWEPHLVTNENGFATASVIMPDNLTSWRLDARAVTGDTLIGQTTTEIVSTLPLIVRAVAPRFFIVGDYLPLVAIVHNNTDEALQVAVQLEQEGLTLDDNSIRHIEVAAHSMERVEWWGTVNDVDGVYMAVTALADNGLSDASIPTLTTAENNTIPVYDFAATEIITTTGILEEAGDNTEAIDLRLNPAPTSGTLSIQLQPGLSASLLETGLNLPVSPNMANSSMAYYLHSYASLSALYINDTETHTHLIEQIENILPELLEAQNSDGGWSWYEQAPSDALITAEILISLRKVAALGIPIEARVLESASAYLKNWLIQPTVNTDAFVLNQQATLLYALALHEQVDKASLDTLYEYRLEMSLAARAQLLLAYLALVPDAEEIASLQSDLISAAIISASGVHWEETIAARHWRGDTRVTSLVLLALVKSESEFPLVPDAIQWLMLARRGNSWRTESENTWAIAAISEWTRQTGELQPDYDFSLSLNDTPLGQGNFGEGSLMQSQLWSFSLADLLPNQLNSFTIQRTDGTGVLYYSSQLELSYPADEAEPIENGLRIEREYLHDSDRMPIQSAQLGEIVVVRLTLYLSENVYYFSLEDKLPAGLEPIDTNLLISSMSAETPRLSSIDRNNRYWYWGFSYWSRMEIHDDGVILQARYLPRGVYTYSYPSRASSLGEFAVRPATAFSAEQLDTFGRSAAHHFTVHPRD